MVNATIGKCHLGEGSKVMKAQNGLDLDHLRRQTQGDDALMREILQLFADQMDLRLSSLSADASDLKEQAHSIKGSARGVGAWALAEAAEAVELASSEPHDALHALRQAMVDAQVSARMLLR